MTYEAPERSGAFLCARRTRAPRTRRRPRSNTLTMHPRTAPAVTAVLAALLLTLCARAAPVPFAGRTADQIADRCVEIAAAVDGAPALDAAIDRLGTTCDTLGAVLRARDLATLAAPEGWLALLTLIDRAGADPTVAARLATFPAFATELGLLAHAQHDNPRGLIALADRLARERPGALTEYPALAAALCVVHDAPNPYARRINENTTRASDPLEIFDYFVEHAKRLTVHPDALPPELLVHVVNTTESPESMRWALARYGANPDIARRFFEIEYDTAHLTRGTPKRVTDAGGYAIETIHRFGGVCADQAYFAESVAKSCGLPSAYVFARGADVSHAWVGFLETRRRRPAWNFDSGRYDDYQNLRGRLTDPQTMTTIADGRLGLTAGLATRSADDRRAVRAAVRLVERMNAGTWSPDPQADFGGLRTRPEPRTGTLDERLALLRAALERCPEVPIAWELVGRMAREHDIDHAALDTWARALDRLCARRHPDFAFDTLADMLRGVDDPRERLGMWDWAHNRYRSRPDLASAVRFEQARILESMGDRHGAWRAYDDIVTSHLNDGPMAVAALDAMGTMLERAGRRAEIIPRLERALVRVERPARMAIQFASQSNHHRISVMLAREYRAAGRDADATAVMRALGTRP